MTKPFSADYVLVYEDTEGVRLNKHDAWRQAFMANLRKVGLDMEEVTQKTILCPLIFLCATYRDVILGSIESLLQAPYFCLPCLLTSTKAGTLIKRTMKRTENTVAECDCCRKHLTCIFLRDARPAYSITTTGSAL